MVAASAETALNEQTAPFEPTSHLPVDDGRPARLSAAIASPVVSQRVTFDRATFFRATSELVLHPERTSSAILRSRILDEWSLLDNPQARLGPTTATDSRCGAAAVEIVRVVRRRLLPTPPSRPLEQKVIFGRSDTEAWVEIRSLVDCPADVSCGQPAVRVLRCAHVVDASQGPPILQLSATPFVDTDVDKRSALFRSCQNYLRALVETAGKRAPERAIVYSSVKVKKAPADNLSCELRRKYGQDTGRGLYSAVDSKARLYAKDFAVAAHLMLLWRDMYPSATGKRSNDRSTWGRPAQFVDLGAGNGLLVHILVSEGYVGVGLDRRPSRVWAAYPATTRMCLQQAAVDPIALALREAGPFDEGMFLIGNHSDELTPWIPILASLTRDGRFLNIPCCAHTLPDVVAAKAFEPSLPIFAPARFRNTGPGTVGKVQVGVFEAYLAWLETLSVQCGFLPEVVLLSFPTPRNLAILGRHRLISKPVEQGVVRAAVLRMVEDIACNRREPEGLTCSSDAGSAG